MAPADSERDADEKTEALAAENAVGATEIRVAAPRHPKFSELKRCFIERLGCWIEERQAPRPIFKGADNEGGPMLPERSHPPRLVSPRGGFVSNLDDYPDEEDVAPSIHRFFCRSLGFRPEEVDPEGPDGRVTSEFPSMTKRRETLRLVTRADGGSSRRKTK